MRSPFTNLLFCILSHSIRSITVPSTIGCCLYVSFLTFIVNVTPFGMLYMLSLMPYVSSTFCTKQQFGGTSKRDRQKPYESYSRDKRSFTGMSSSGISFSIARSASRRFAAFFSTSVFVMRFLPSVNSLKICISFNDLPNGAKQPRPINSSMLFFLRHVSFCRYTSISAKVSNFCRDALYRSSATCCDIDFTDDSDCEIVFFSRSISQSRLSSPNVPALSVSPRYALISLRIAAIFSSLRFSVKSFSITLQNSYGQWTFRQAEYNESHAIEKACAAHFIPSVSRYLLGEQTISSPTQVGHSASGCGVSPQTYSLSGQSLHLHGFLRAWHGIAV